jgi:hypothetical protein
VAHSGTSNGPSPGPVVPAYRKLHRFPVVKCQLRAPQCVNSGKKCNFLTGVIKTSWVLLNMKRFRLPSMLDSGSSLSFMRQDVFQRIKELGLSHVTEATEERFLTENSNACRAIQAVTMSVKLQ